MKHTYSLDMLLLASCTSPIWPTFAINPHLAVRLPEAPQPVPLVGMRFDSPATQATATSPGVRAWVAADRAGSYGIIINRDALPAGLRQSVVPDSFYNQAIRNVLERQHGRLLVRSAFVTPAGKGIEVKLSQVPTPDNQAAIQYVRTVLLGRAAYTFTFQPSEGQDAQTAKQRRRFFSSIALKP